MSNIEDCKKNIHNALFAKMAAVPFIPADVIGVEYKGKCPCGGIITAKRVGTKGHLRAKCNKCKWRLVE